MTESIDPRKIRPGDRVLAEHVVDHVTPDGVAVLFAHGQVVNKCKGFIVTRAELREHIPADCPEEES